LFRSALWPGWATVKPNSPIKLAVTSRPMDTGRGNVISMFIILWMDMHALHLAYPWRGWVSPKCPNTDTKSVTMWVSLLIDTNRWTTATPCCLERLTYTDEVIRVSTECCGSFGVSHVTPFYTANRQWVVFISRQIRPGVDPEYQLVAWLSGRTSVFGRRPFSVLRSTCSWRVTTYVGKPSAMGQPTRPTQHFIPSGSIDE